MGGRVDFEVDLAASRSGQCRSCGAAIEWIRRDGKWLPLHVASQERRNGKAFMESHFAHCPQADKWRNQPGLFGDS